MISSAPWRSTGREGDERARLEELRRRLQDAARRADDGIHPETRLRELVGSLPGDPAAALQTIEGLLSRHRAARQTAGDPPAETKPEESRHG